MDLFDLSETYGSMDAALSRVKGPVMVIGVKTDQLFPVWQQRQLAKDLQAAGKLSSSLHFHADCLYMTASREKGPLSQKSIIE